jgi:uncharacterized membrane protein YbhN (UPF0104 family)
MRRLYQHPIALTTTAFILAAAAVVGIGSAYGWGRFATPWEHPHWGWLALALGAGLLSHVAYAFAYRTVAEADGAPELPRPLLMRLVAAGFGPFVLRGGFGVDHRVLRALHDDDEGALSRMLGLGSLEWLLLAPAACISAIVLLVEADPRPLPSMLWPWALLVPLGFAVGGWLVHPRRRRRWEASGGAVRCRVARAAQSVDVLVLLVRRAGTALAAFGGMALYWALDIAAFVGAARFLGLHASLPELIVAYGTGYALTRRTMPFGGAGVTEALMTFALHWMGQAVAPALAVVVLYRTLNFGLPTIPALLARPRVMPLLRAGEADRAATAREHRDASAPIRARPAPSGQASRLSA